MSDQVNDVRPFRALHYNPEKIRDIGLCLSQPYDVIDPEQLEKYMNRHPNNIVHLTLPKITPEDTESDNRYTRARDTLAEWRSREIINVTGIPAFWAYGQEFQIPTGEIRKVRGFIGLVRLEDYESMKILPHEKVLKKPVEDRIKLTRETNTQFEYIWGIYKDKKCALDGILRSCEFERPIIDFNEIDMGVKHKFWKLADKDQCDTISSVMGKCKIYIADGHHRYRTMLDIRDEYRTLHPHTKKDAPWEYIMMYLTNSEHEGLTILPTHRMCNNLGINDWAQVIKTIEKYFEVTKLDFDTHNEQQVRENWIVSINKGEGRDKKFTLYSKQPDMSIYGWRKDNSKEKRFGLYLKGRNTYFVLTLKDISAYNALVPKGNSIDWKMLDVNIVNYLLLKEAFGIGEEELSLGEKIKYVIDPNEAAEKVTTGVMDAAIILNPTKLDQVLTIADNKEIMPRKSTYFYPKPLSGLVMYSMDEKDA